MQHKDNMRPCTGFSSAGTSCHDANCAKHLRNHSAALTFAQLLSVSPVRVSLPTQVFCFHLDSFLTGILNLRIAGDELSGLIRLNFNADCVYSHI
jgi:hypothetical protein